MLLKTLKFDSSGFEFGVSALGRAEIRPRGGGWGRMETVFKITACLLHQRTIVFNRYQGAMADSRATPS